jgi:type II secretory pathway pseudopilin PulG
MARSIRKLNRRGEEGYMLIAVLFLVVMVLITLSIAAPKMAKEIERDREIELVHRGKQFQRAIQLYYRKFGAYPPNMEALEKTNNIRFLRRRYKDPMTGKDEWHLIHFGENKTPTALGFFGQPISGVGGATLAGTGPGGVGQNIGSPIGGGGAFGSNGGGAFGNNNGGGGFGSNSGSSFGNSGSSLFSNNSSNGTNGVAGLGTNSPNGSDPTAARTDSPPIPTQPMAVPMVHPAHRRSSATAPGPTRRLAAAGSSG